ncbi:hypothetical protein RFI_10883 [Reticulomyxa filosa]|uniref:Uncharacterized protein n=1 Tax=Reticulomyxa filosa TaxID=46433 RepID=X6NIU8_RETFI|nr:hypothetical protein RFI_10883 [Reticulomyxa filosa]|eukprot:ETO26255.1 hypothetical protein RFI_10883 [Reticulomyxa filosa]
MKLKLKILTDAIEKENMKSKSKKMSDAKRHWSIAWTTVNWTAAIKVEQMLRKHEQGLIVIANNTHEWKHLNVNKGSDSDCSFRKLINDKSVVIKKKEDYLIYVIIKKMIILDDVTINGNVYAVDCDIRCQGQIDEQLRSSLAPIQWNTKMHYHIPLQLQNLQHKKQESLIAELFDEAIVYSQQFLQIYLDSFGFAFPLVADTYDCLGVLFNNKGQYDQAIECHEKALKITTDILGTDNTFAAAIDANLGLAYYNRGEADTAAEHYEKVLQIRLDILGSNHLDVADTYSFLGFLCEDLARYTQSIECHEKALMIRKAILGHDKIVGDSIWDLGRAYEVINRTDKADEYFNEAWKIYKQIIQQKQDKKLLSCELKKI